MKGIHIVATGRAVPSKKMSNDELSKIVDTSDEWIVARTGIKSRYISENEKNYELAAEAGSRAMEKGGIRPEQIGAVIVATVSPDYIFPTIACMVQKELGIPTDIMAFDISAACTGFLYGLKISKGLLENMEKPYLLVIGSEQISRILDFTDRSTCVLFGDGAGAAIVELSDTHLYYQRVWASGDDQVLTCLGPGNAEAFLQMDGNAVYRFAVKAAKEGIDTVLQDAGLTVDDVDYILCHQANARIIDYVKKKYTVSEDKFFINLDEYANTSAASIPIALDEMWERGMIKDGTKIVCVAFGAGFTWSSVLLTF